MNADNVTFMVSCYFAGLVAFATVAAVFVSALRVVAHQTNRWLPTAKKYFSQAGKHQAFAAS